MSELIKVNNLGKMYTSYDSEYKRLLTSFGKKIKPLEKNWIFRHLNFIVNSGESLGIVGDNGSGKSTLLKLISGTLIPTEGNVQINGKLSAILELAMGFNAELSGKQNTIFYLSMMGFNFREIKNILSTVQEFSELGNYFDKPLRIYSSGMQLRLAFSVATAYQPDILIIDEALAVGDTYFQKKCFNRIKTYQKNGSTLVIVSHDQNAIQSLCDRAIFINDKKIIKDSNPFAVYESYLKIKT